MSDNQFNYLAYVLPYRRRLQARGLTVLGRPRLNRCRPELAGLPNHGAEYHRHYMRLRRAELNTEH